MYVQSKREYEKQVANEEAEQLRNLQVSSVFKINLQFSEIRKEQLLLNIIFLIYYSTPHLLVILLTCYSEAQIIVLVACIF
jgi:hypothetical protein